MAANQPVWWRDAVVYQVYWRSFADANGDGIGDLEGIRSRLGYLAELGVDALWISPWYPSPWADGGYDVADYRGIAPEAGTMAQAAGLVAEAHAHGLRVLIDLVPNHTSDHHPWFRAALAAPPGAPERRRYHFRRGRGRLGEQPPNNWTSVFSGPAWTRTADDSDAEWYLHLFSPRQPDVNWGDPDIRREFMEILDFWWDRGVDGFRIDAASGLVKDPRLPDLTPEQLPGSPRPPSDRDHPYEDRVGVHEIYRTWRRAADERDPPRVLVGEVWAGDPRRLARYATPDQLHAMLDFELLRAPFAALALRAAIDAVHREFRGIGAAPGWVLSNHDVIRVATRFSRPAGREQDPAGSGVSSDPAIGLRRARAAALLQLGLPGQAYIYQGDELGLPEVETLLESSLTDPVWELSGRTIRGRDGCRVPIPWARSGPSFGFGQAPGWLPQPPDWGGLSVEAQTDDPASTLNLYRQALRIRRAETAMRGDDLTWIESGPDVVAFLRHAPGSRRAVAIVLNAGAVPVPLPRGDVLLASGQLDGGRLPPSTAAWVLSAPDRR